MTIYLDVIVVLNFLIDWLLLIATERLCGFPIDWKRCTIAALIGGIYGGVCVIPQTTFLSNIIWRIICLVLMGVTAFGFNVFAVRKCVIFTVLSFALGGAVIGLNKGGIGSVIGAACVFCLFSFIVMSGSIGVRRFIPVKFCQNGDRLSITALLDTGNTLTDPVTGKAVLVVSAQVAERLTGLSETQLRFPIETIRDAKIDGLRLIPYHSVGKDGGLLLAMRMKEVTIGRCTGSALVAFSPDKLGNGFDALAGGMSI